MVVNTIDWKQTSRGADRSWEDMTRAYGAFLMLAYRKSGGHDGAEAGDAGDEACASCSKLR